MRLQVDLTGVSESQVPDLVFALNTAVRGMKPVDAFLSSEHQISFHRRQNRSVLEAILAVFVTKLSDAQMTTSRMNPNQILTCVEDLVDEFWMLKLEEMILILSEARKKKTFNRLDQSVIFECFREYLENRQSVVEESRRQSLKASEEEKQEEIELIKNTYESIKDGSTTPLCEAFSVMKKQERYDKAIREAEYKDYKAKYYENKPKQAEPDAEESAA